MKKRIHLLIITIFALLGVSKLSAQMLLIPMDEAQNNHLKAYGLAYEVIATGQNVEWLLNYRGGSFAMPALPSVEKAALLKGISAEKISSGAYQQILQQIEAGNMDVMILETAPKIAVYTPPNKLPWDDAVTMALTYAEIPYDKIYDTEVLQGKLYDYDWLHLHHEDFTGQYGKFYRNYRNAAWYIEEKATQEALAKSLGFRKVPDLKKAVVRAIRDYVANGGFMFAMCAATDTYEIALAAMNVDIVHQVFDGDPIDPNYQDKLNFESTFAFENFKLLPDPMVYEYSDLDIPPSDQPLTLDANRDYFSLFEFSAKWDPVPAMLTQNHTALVKGFMGQTTNFKREYIKDHVIIMGETVNTQRVRYIHGNYGKGTFTYYGGHDPEDYRHYVGDPPTNLDLHKNSPGYRLILNNVLFPAAQKQERKT
jgi:hypothetical protein